MRADKKNTGGKLNLNEGDAHSKTSLRAWLYLMKCAKRLEQEMSDRLRENYSSSFSRFDVMAHLDFAGDKGLSTSQLASRLLASKGNITRLLDRMEKDELIIRKPCTNDRRVSNIYLSGNGKSLFAQMAPDHESWSNDLFDSLSAEEKETLVRLLKSMKSGLDLI